VAAADGLRVAVHSAFVVTVDSGYFFTLAHGQRLPRRMSTDGRAYRACRSPGTVHANLVIQYGCCHTHERYTRCLTCDFDDCRLSPFPTGHIPLAAVRLYKRRRPLVTCQPRDIIDLRFPTYACENHFWDEGQLPMSRMARISRPISTRPRQVIRSCWVGRICLTTTITVKNN